MAINYISIGSRIRSSRKRRGITQILLSELIDKSPAYISYIESGVKSLSLETFIDIANALGVSADELLQDNLENTIKVSNHALADTLNDCSEYETRIIISSVQSLKAALRDNRQYYRRQR